MLTGAAILTLALIVGAIFALFVALIGVAIGGSVLVELRNMLRRHRRAGQDESDWSPDA